MPMHNAEAYVRAAVESVLTQRGVDLELIVVDDHSADRSRAVVSQIADSRVRLIDSPKRYMAAANNAGLSVARGDILTRCDADDLLPPDCIRWRVEWLRDHPEFGAVSASFSTVTRKGKLVAALSCGTVGEEITHELRAGVTRNHFCTFAIRMAIVRRVGGWREFFVSSSEIDLQLRVGEACRVWFEPRSCYLYRLHDSSITHSQSSTLRTFYESTALRFQGQRQTSGLDDLQRGRPPELPSGSLSPPGLASFQVRGMLWGRAWREHEAGEKRRAVLTGLRACLLQPTDIRMWLGLLVLIVKRSGGGALGGADK